MPLKQKNHIVVDMCIGVPVFLRHSVYSNFSGQKVVWPKLKSVHNF